MSIEHRMCQKLHLVGVLLLRSENKRGLSTFYGKHDIYIELRIGIRDKLLCASRTRYVQRQLSSLRHSTPTGCGCWDTTFPIDMAPLQGEENT